MINLSQQFSVAVWSDDPGSDNQTLIETLVEMREVVGTVVDIIVAHCLSLMTQNRRQTMGRLVLWPAGSELRQPTTIILAGRVLLPVWPALASQAVTGQVAFSDIL